MSEKRYAILIGINDYSNSSDELSYSAADVDKLHSRLISNCRFDAENIYPITSTKDKPHLDILGAYQHSLTDIRAKFKTGDTILFYFSGHGQASSEGLILEIKDEKLPFKNIYEDIEAMESGRQFYIIDACHAGAGAELKSSDLEALNDYYNERLATKSGGLQILCSCQANERSRAWGHLGSSVYTYYLVEAMANRNFYDRELQTLSLMNMHEYAAKKIDLHKDPQTPFLITQSSGYYPFAFAGPEQISACSITLNVHGEDQVYKFLEREDLNFPKGFKRDFSQLMSELSLNLFRHNYSRGFDLVFDKNTIEVRDHSDQSFNPFTAQITANGQGLLVYKRFFDKYSGRVKTTYIPGSPNIIRMEFDESVFSGLSADPCYLAVSETFLESLTPLNQYNYDVDCETLTIDVSRSHFPLSICLNMFDELIRRTERKKPLIIIKLAQDDMLRQDVANRIKYGEYDRIVLF